MGIFWEDSWASQSQDPENLYAKTGCWSAIARSPTFKNITLFMASGISKKTAAQEQSMVVWKHLKAMRTNAVFEYVIMYIRRNICCICIYFF